jgi:hypothetical protein
MSVPTNAFLTKRAGKGRISLLGVIAGLVAVAAVAAGRLFGWQGVDYAAQVYRIDLWRHSGFRLWDFRWYGGHWTLDYSFLFPPLASVLGVGVLAAGSAGVAAVCFDRIVRPRLGRGGLPASLVFAAGTLVPAAIGQLTFLVGLAFGLAALATITSGGHKAVSPRTAVAAALGLACTLCSPLAGAFLALAVAARAWPAVQRHSYEGLGVAALLVVVAIGPVAGAAALFPGDGPMPYPAVDYAWEMLVAGGVAALAGRNRREVQAGAALFAAAATLSLIVPNPAGGNIGRLEDVLALPLAVGFAWERFRPGLAGRIWAVPAVALPLVLSQWGPAWGAITTSGEQASVRAAYYAPLDQELARLAADGPAGRVEVVPTAYHWESVYVSGVVPLARGWERQLDVADNPIFYRKGALTGRSYRAWLIDNGVRFVALPRAPLDMAGVGEARLVSSGRVPGLRLLWRSADWRLYEVEGSPGIVASPDRLVSATGEQLVVDAARPGPLLVRIRYSPDWVVAEGRASISRGEGSWIALDVPSAEEVTLHLSLLR